MIVEFFGTFRLADHRLDSVTALLVDGGNDIVQCLLENGKDGSIGTTALWTVDYPEIWHTRQSDGEV